MTNALTNGERSKVYELCNLRLTCTCEPKAQFCDRLVKYLEEAAWDVNLADYIIQEDQLNKTMSEE